MRRDADREERNARLLAGVVLAAMLVLLFGIIPFKMKYLGWYELALWVINFLLGGVATKVSLVLGLSGFLAFYGREVFFWCRDAIASWKRRRDWENRNRSFRNL